VPDKLKKYELAIIGAGPAGLATAVEAFESGISRDATIVLEKGAVPIDAIRKFYPEKKMTIANYKGLPTENKGHLPSFPDLTKAETLVYFDQIIENFKIPVRYNTEVFKVLRKDSEFEVWYGHENLMAKAVVIGIGILGRPNKPNYKVPNSLRDHVLYDLTSQSIENKKVLVVGGGDTSSEYCQILVGEKNEVTLLSRRADYSKMMDQNAGACKKLLAENRLKVFLGAELKEIQDKDGKPFAISLDESKFTSETYDKVIFAMGGSTPINFLKTVGIECETTGPKYNEFGETNIPGVYLVGDLVLGKTGGSIITAYNSALKAATKIKEYLDKAKQ
jgi:thioredoxin reductase (NADPH)